MPIVNTSKPTTSIENTDRVVGYETWETNTTTWATETRTWAEMQSDMDNIAKPTTTITNTSKP